MNDYIKLPREEIESFSLANEKLFKIWIWCLYKISPVDYKEQIILPNFKVKAGQFITNRNEGTSDLNIKSATWYRHMKKLEEFGIIKLESISKRLLLVTVVDWGKYL